MTDMYSIMLNLPSWLFNPRTWSRGEQHVVSKDDVSLLISLAASKNRHIPQVTGFLRGMRGKLFHSRQTPDVVMTTRQMNALITLAGY